ncbi:hypothetical protein CY658_08245 [Variovorax sp. RO1]|uniref:Ig-like domain-containing protein n=1 Tax=Variovorax sp. RO1 TaxID=2066034 RepID=UPI000C716C0F|nr:Ig-like domain-containing protein [Variovorax sp. RO1]PLC06973.1 hypothetical protein CY658_08245 [Variovorax sp. RO1]
MASQQTNVVADDKNTSAAASAGASTFAVQPPAMGDVFDNAGDILGTLVAGAISDDRQPDFHGQGTPGDTILIKDNGIDIGRTTVGTDGQWSFTPSSDLAEGLHAITLVARDTAGNESLPSAAFNFEIDVTPPDASQLSITGILDAVGGITGNVIAGGTTDDARPLISGASSGVPGHTVIVTIRDANGQRELGHAVIGENGNWTLQVDTPLAAGMNMFRVFERDAAGNETALTAPYRVTVDTSSIAAPVIQSVQDDVGTTEMLQQGAVTNDTRPTFAGTAQAGATVKFYDGAIQIGEVVADASGKWHFTPEASLADGAHTVTATATNLLGQTSDASAAWNFTVDTVAPAAPTIVSVADDVGSTVTADMAAGTLTDDARPGFKGKAEANSTVVIYDKGVEIDRVQANASGDWAYTPATPLADGTHSITVAAIDVAGNVSAQSAAFGFTVDTVAPGVPTLVSVTDDVAPQIGNVAKGGFTNDTRPTLAGKAEAGSTVVIYDKGVKLDTVLADASGNWSYTPAAALSEGAHSITVAAMDKAGNTSAQSAAVGFTVDTVAPNAVPVIVSVTDDVGPVTGNLGNGATTDDTRPAFAGTATANATVVIFDKGVEIARVKADALGKWAYTPATAFSEGAHSVAVAHTDGAGNIGAKSPAFALTVATAAPTVPTLVSVTDDVAPQIGNVAKDGFTNDTRPALAGKADAGSTVTIYDKGVKLDSVLADASGNWSYTPATALAQGVHTITVAATNQAGITSAPSAAFGFTVDSVAPTVPTLVSVTDDVAPQIGNVVKDGFTNDTRPTLAGKAEAGSTVTIYDKGVKLGTALADASGNWSYTPTTALSQGVHSITVAATDKADNTSASSDAFAFTVDTTAPTQIATLTDMGKDSGTSASDFLTNDGSAGRLLRGTLSAPLAAGDTLQVSTDGGTTWKPAIVAGNKWSAQDDNSHASSWTVQTRVTDAAGNVGPVNSQAIALDTTAPNAPNSMSISGAQATVTFDKANAQVGGQISLTSGEKRYDHVLTAADVAAGRVVVNAPFALGSQTNVGLVDKAGNVSAESLRQSSYLENFNAITGAINLPTGASYKLGSLTFQSLSSSGGSVNGLTYPQGLYSSNYTPHMIQKPYSNALWIAGSMRVSLDSSLSLSANKLSFYMGDNNNYASIRLYANDGSLLHSATISPLSGTVTIDVSTSGKSFSRFEITTYHNAGQRGNDQLWIDNIEISSSAKVSSSGVFTLAPDTAAVLHGDAGNNVFLVGAVADFNDSGIAGKGGLDTLKLTGTGQTLDLTALAGKVSSIEIVDLTGTGNNTLKLSLTDVMENGAKDQFVANGRVQMMVKGNAGDKVTLTDLLPDGTDPGDWIKKANVTVSGVVYEVYQHSGFGAELLVQQGVTVTLQNKAATFSSMALEVDADVLDVHSGYGAEVLSHATQAFTEGDDTLIARLGFADRLGGGAGNDTITHIGTGDVAHGGAGDDTVRIHSGDFERIDGGLGIDTLVMDGKAMRIDLSAFGLNVQGFEKFDLGAGGNTLALSTSDVLAGGVRDMVTADGKVQMLVNGANGDVDLLGGSAGDNGWTSGGNAMVGGVTYSVYTNLAGTAELLVEDKVHVTIL